MADTSYDAVFGVPMSFTFTPDSGTPFGSAQAQVEENTPAPADVEVARYTPISGPNANNEQVAVGRTASQSVRIKATYGAAEHAAALALQQARSRGTLVVTYADDGSSYTYEGFLKTVTPSSVNATGVRSDDLTFTVAGGFDFDPAT